MKMKSVKYLFRAGSVRDKVRHNLVSINVWGNVWNNVRDNVWNNVGNNVADIMKGKLS